MIDHELKEIKDKIFLLTFNNRFDLGMTFLRAQEYYENPNKDFKGKNFRIIDFIEWYSKEINKDNCFSYCDDFCGFNIPSWVLDKLYSQESASLFEDWNKYDGLIYKTYLDLKKKHNKFYLIGSIEKNNTTINHEIAHALYYLNNDYYSEVTKIIDSIHPQTKELLKKTLIEEMYCHESIDDEIQAYLSTGLLDKMRRKLNSNKIGVKSLRKPFIDLLKKYS